MLTALGAIFSSARIYLYVALLLAAAAVASYIFYLRYEASAAEARLAGAQATISVSNAALATDAGTIQSLQQQSADAQAALVQTAAATEATQDILHKVEEAVAHVPRPKACQSLDARDLAVIAGVRELLAPAARPSNKHN